MARKLDPDFARVRRLRRAAPELSAEEIAEAADHKLWLGVLGKADLAGRLYREPGEIAKELEKAGLDYSTKELSALSPLARPPRKKDVVLYTRKGKVVGYSVGATPLNT
jgi:hypothetical protein